MAAHRAGLLDPLFEGDNGTDGVVDPDGSCLRRGEQPGGEVADIDDLRGNVGGVGDQHGRVWLTRGTGNPVAGAVTVIARATDEPSARYQQAVAHHRGRRLLARDLRLAVLLT